MKNLPWVAVLLLIIAGVTIASNTDDVQTSGGYTPPDQAAPPEPLPSMQGAPSITYTKPVDPSRQKIEGDIQTTKTYTVTIQSPDGNYPIREVREALAHADGVRVTGVTLMPWHACDSAADCAAEIDETCIDNEAGGQDTTVAVSLRWSERLGFGTCDGFCANGGTVLIRCLRIRPDGK